MAVGGPFDMIDSSDVRAALESIVSVVVAHGGSIHPDARFHEHEGNLSVQCVGGRDGDLLLRIPRALLIPTDGLVWAEGTTMRLLETPDGLTGIQRELLDLHVEMYNAADKLAWARGSLPRVALAGHAEVLEAIAVLRPGFGPWDRNVAEAFLGTRVLRLSPNEVRTGGSESGAPAGPACLMPLMDLLNNSVSGSPFARGPNGLDVAIRRLPGSEECYANYGRRMDSLDLMLHYGYLDSATRLARCGRVGVVVRCAGSIEVDWRMRPPRHPLDPPTITRSDSGLFFSHLTFQAEHPERLGATLGLVVRSASLAAGADDALAGRVAVDAIALIAEQNIRALDSIAVAAGHVRGEMFDQVAAACAHQASIIKQVVASYG